MSTWSTVANALQTRVCHPNALAWYVFACALDLCLTYTVVFRLGGREVNGLAQFALELGGFWGLITLKMLTMIVVIAACECIARQRPSSARRLAEWAVAISAIPAVLALVQIAQLR